MTKVLKLLSEILENQTSIYPEQVEEIRCSIKEVTPSILGKLIQIKKSLFEQDIYFNHLFNELANMYFDVRKETELSVRDQVFHELCFEEEE